ncbi:MAG: hypothetical protein GY943_14205 [Chloroflexi bacterium]|nr:hypothetical protein [Chloroflexota bacterium]
MDNENFEPDVIAETENFAVWRGEEEDEGYVYHLELGGITLHIKADEWEEVITLFKSIP